MAIFYLECARLPLSAASSCTIDKCIIVIKTQWLVAQIVLLLTAQLITYSG